MDRLGVCVIGAGGAVASTMMAGTLLMRRGLAPRVGMITETGVGEKLGVAPLDGLVFGGWDLRSSDLYEATVREKIVPRHLADQVKDELSAIKPWPGVVSPAFLGTSPGSHVVTARGHREELERMADDVRAF